MPMEPDSSGPDTGAAEKGMQRKVTGTGCVEPVARQAGSAINPGG